MPACLGRYIGLFSKVAECTQFNWFSDLLSHMSYSCSDVPLWVIVNLLSFGTATKSCIIPNVWSAQMSLCLSQNFLKFRARSVCCLKGIVAYVSMTRNWNQVIFNRQKPYRYTIRHVCQLNKQLKTCLELCIRMHTFRDCGISQVMHMLFVECLKIASTGIS